MKLIKIANHMPNRQRCGITTYANNLYAEAEGRDDVKLTPFDTKFKDLLSLIFKPIDIVHFQHEFGIWPVMGLFFVIIYIGAISVLFLFVILMLDLKTNIKKFVNLQLLPICF